MIVKITLDQELFDDKTLEEMKKIAYKIIMIKFRDKVIGNEYVAYINKTSAKKYTNPFKSIDKDIVKSKMRASPELDKLMESAVFIKHEDDDGRHPKAIGGWDYYEVKFNILDIDFSAVINVMNTDKGSIFYDITKIRNISAVHQMSVDNNPHARYRTETSLDNNLTNNDENVNMKK